MTAWHFMTIAEASSGLRDRMISPVELTAAYFARIAALDDTLNAYTNCRKQRPAHPYRVMPGEGPVPTARGAEVVDTRPRRA